MISFTETTIFMVYNDFSSNDLACTHFNDVTSNTMISFLRNNDFSNNDFIFNFINDLSLLTMISTLYRAQVSSNDLYTTIL